MTRKALRKQQCALSKALLRGATGQTGLSFLATSDYLSAMRLNPTALWFALWLALSLPAAGADGRVIKVLPEFLDLKGRNSLTASLYERDAYQVYLREHPDKRSGLRFYVQWKLKGDAAEPLTLRVDLRGVVQGKLPKEMALESSVQPKGGWFSHWTALTLGGEDYKKFGQVTAWRATFWEGRRLLGEQHSFLW
jgi:hypothetical protein